MTHLNALAFVSVPKHSALSPLQVRRNRLIERLEEQKRLNSDPSYSPVVKRWKKTVDGSKVLQDHFRRLKPWWRTDDVGNVVLTIKIGLRTLEFEKGKTGIAVGAPERLEGVIDTLIAAIRAGELDRFLTTSSDVEGPMVTKAKKTI